MKTKNSKGIVVSIKGRKFFMDPTGKTLKCLSVEKKSAPSDNSESNDVRRISLGGVTYTRRSKNVLVRSSSLPASHRVSQAVQKSISTLSKKKKKNNQTCIFFKRFGKCFRNEKGNCPYVHDLRKVDVCKRFLAGLCQQSDCPLSHNTVPEKMPTCQYFLEGCCNRTDCPYMHVKVNASADLCLQFLEGYCSMGQECPKRHELLCPEFERLGTCSKGKYCPFPHKNSRTDSKRGKGDSKEALGMKKITDCKFSKKGIVEGRKRYYDNSLVEKDGVPIDERPDDEEASNLKSDETSADASLQEKRERLMKKVEVLKSFWLNPNETPNDKHPTINRVMVNATDDQRGYSRPKLGPLPTFIPL